MHYNDEMKKSIERINSTREERISQKIHHLDMKEGRKLLEDYHPDYIKEGQRALKFGPNKGDFVASEIADLIESYSLVNPSKIDLLKIDFDVDVLVIGGGGGGLSSTLEAFKAGANVFLATKLRLGDANTVMAQGGIQAADKATDSPIIHYVDVMGGGHFTNDPELVRVLTEDAPKTLKWLESLGVMFDKRSDGEMKTIHGGGTSRKRMHSARDYTGLEILRVLKDEFLNLKIPYLEFCAVIEFIKDEKGQIAGAVLLNMETNKLLICRAKTVIVATGGMGRLHIQGFPCTNHYGATADGIVLGNRAGIPFIFMNAIQYHPTGGAFPEQILGLLVTEKVRGLGAQLLNKNGERFIYELMPRDIVASAIIREVKALQNGVATPSGMQGVWLDSPLIDIIHGKGTIKKELPAMYRQYEKYGIHIDNDPILVYPTQHYQCGGLKININAQTKIKNLFAVGEVSGGIHGENRLMGNSLLDILVFGRRAGVVAADLIKNIVLGNLSLNHVIEHNKQVEKLKVPKERKSPILLPDYN